MITAKVKKLFIFDLDGTLVDAYQAISASLNFCRDKFGYEPVAFEVIKSNIGHGDKNFVAQFFPKNQVEKALSLYRTHHKGSLKKHAKLKPYAKAMLYNLKRRKKLLAIASNRPAAYTDIVVKALDIKKYFDFILCADQINSLKPKPKILFEVLKKLDVQIQDAVYAGDMDVDMDTAQRAKMDAIFVAGGSSTVQEVSQYKNKIIVNVLKEVCGNFQ
ncbi:MAG: HAD family hydrolase [Candidatus Omnitrophica bacterium]|nr:HAD family hydrolase [Candidatus Omnitrophota bacterium]